MTATNGILALVGDAALLNDVDRVAAAAGLPVVHASAPSGRSRWAAPGAAAPSPRGPRPPPPPPRRPKGRGRGGCPPAASRPPPDDARTERCRGAAGSF